MGPEVCWPRFPIIVPRCQKGDCPCPRLYLPQLCAQLAEGERASRFHTPTDALSSEGVGVPETRVPGRPTH